MQACQGLRETGIPEKQVAGASSSELTAPEVGELDKYSFLCSLSSRNQQTASMDIQKILIRDSDWHTDQ